MDIIPLTYIYYMDTIAILVIWQLEMAMRKTTVFIDEKLLEEAIKAIGARTKKEAIEEGLRSLVKKHHKELFKNELGTYDLDLSLDELENLRNAE